MPTPADADFRHFSLSRRFLLLREIALIFRYFFEAAAFAIAAAAAAAAAATPRFSPALRRHYFRFALA
jgi:hypothetical protein